MALVTISRNIGAGGTTVARRVADGLDLELFDDNRLQQEAVQLGIRSEELKSLDEKAPGFLDRISGNRPDLYLDLMEEVIYEVARKGEGVIVGHGSQMLLRDFSCALHVHIYAPESSRIQRVMDQRELSRSAAEKMVRKSDHERAGFLRYAFRMDWYDPSLYDLTVNTEKLGLDLAARLIMEGARSQEVKECSATALEAMERFSLLKKIEAELLRKNFSLTRLHVEVPEKGVALISGWAETEAEKARLTKLVQEISGVTGIQSEVVVMPAGAV